MLSRRTILGGGLALPLTCGSLRGAETQARLILLGQALLQNNVNEVQWPEKSQFASLLKGADLCFSDLETSVKGPDTGPALRKGEFLHTADAGVLDCLKSIHVNMLATSNNHAFDLGPAGISDAIAALDARGISHAGTGINLDEASGPAYRKTPHGIFALVAAASGNITPGGGAGPGRSGVNEIRRDATGNLNEGDVTRMLDALHLAARNADFVIAYQHNHYWEKNMGDTPPWQRIFAKRCIESGASVFISHGAPLLQGIEIYNGKPIFYDLGGLFFQTVTEPGHYPPEVWQGVVAECQCGRSGITGIRLLPTQLNDTGLGGGSDMITRGMPSFAQGNDAEGILKRLAALSVQYNTKIELMGDAAFIRL